MNRSTLIGGGTVSTNPGPSWHAIGTGDFNSDGHSDILLQSTSGQTASWDLNGANIIGGGTVSIKCRTKLERDRANLITSKDRVQVGLWRLSPGP